jgi:hypothetical protein
MLGATFVPLTTPSLTLLQLVTQQDTRNHILGTVLERFDIYFALSLILVVIRLELSNALLSFLV